MPAPDLQGGRVTYTYTFSEQEFARDLNSTFAFAVRGLTRGFRGRPIEGELSNVASATLLDVCPPVASVTVDQPTEFALQVRWTACTRTITGNSVSGLKYRVYKSTTGQPGSFESVGETRATSFLDEDFQFAHSYFYKVRAIFRQEQQVAQTEDSSPAEITPRDVFPPRAPTGFTAVYTVGRVELIWNANTEPDMAGYNVYRREDSGTPRRISSSPVTLPTFRDTSISAGHTYSYWVTALDTSYNESQPSATTQVETQ